MKKLKYLIYDGIYYPTIGCRSTCFENKSNPIAWMKKLGGYVGWFSWLPYIGLKCKLKNPDKPYKQFVIDAIENHPEMKIDKWYFNDDYPEQGYMYIVRTKKNEYIGNIKDAYYITDLNCLRSINNTICYGWDHKNEKACGWSHRAKMCFGVNDKIFQSNFGDDNTLYKQHGRKTIRNYSDAMEAAKNFAKYIS